MNNLQKTICMYKYVFFKLCKNNIKIFLFLLVLQNLQNYQKQRYSTFFFFCDLKLYNYIQFVV